MSAPQRIWARWGFDPHWGVRAGLTLEARDSRVVRIEFHPRPPADFTSTEIHDGLATPGLLNAHAHLNYGSSPDLPRGGFAPWLDAIIQQRQAARATPEAADAERLGLARKATEALREDGVRAVWDIASFPAGRTALREAAMAGISFWEVIHPAPGLEEAQCERIGAAWQAHQRECAPPLLAGLSPHAPYSVCEAMLRHVIALARSARAPLAMHLAESPEELEWFATGKGALAEILTHAAGLRAPPQPPAPGLSPLAWADQVGLLAPDCLVIHANLPRPSDAERLARAQAPVVFCPRSHGWFAYPEYPLAQYRAAGVRLALGTDSLASNDQLSIRAELRWMLEHWPAAQLKDWSPRELLGLATGAMLGGLPPFGGRGAFAPGHPADWVCWPLAAENVTLTSDDALAGLLAAPGPQRIL